MLDKDAGSLFIADSSVVGYDGGQYVREEDRRVQREPRTVRERALLLLRAALLPGWSPTASQGLVWAIRGVIVLGVIVLVASAVHKTLWDWLDLLIVPVVLAIGGYLFNSSQNRATEAAAERRAQDEALQAYLKDMLDMLIPKEDQPSLSDTSPPDSLRSVARARTLAVLPRLEGYRKVRVVQFLYESRLISGVPPVLILKKADLSGTDLRDAYLVGADLEEADLRQVLSNGATYLGSANLSKAKMSGISLSGANVNQADLRRADLSRADLGTTYLYTAQLGHANLKEANLRGAKLSGADLSGADLSGADLSGADLSGARGVAYEQLDKARSLAGTIMPDGQKYEDWLKDKEGGKND